MKLIIKHDKDPEVIRKISELIKGTPNWRSDSIRVEDGYYCGYDDWSSYVSERGGHGSYSGHTFLDSSTQLVEIISALGGLPTFDETPLPQFDETPLPHDDMKPETAKKTQLKFNLSPEQWEMLPPMARKALAGHKISVKQVAFKWNKVSDGAPPHAISVLVSSSYDPENDAGALGFGYWNSDGNYEPVHGISHPVWWAHLPVKP